jgi:6,7-dimethyl-8-ribityllumazine synthase
MVPKGGIRFSVAAALADQERTWSVGMAGPRQGKREQSGAKGARILIVEARFYDDIADALLAGAMQALDEAKAKVDRISVPGALELPTAIAIAQDAAQRKRRPYDGAVALGCVIRGDTIHFEIVSQQSAAGLMELSVARLLPIGNGIITVDTEAQAWARAKLEEQDKGGDAARAALALVGLKQRLGKR